jgi:uncharacterized phiE125 gp8 family phage protein
MAGGRTMPLDTLTNVKSRLGISGSSDDTLLTQLMESAERWITEYTGRNFLGGTFTEYFPGNTEHLCLTNYPVASVISVRLDPTETFGPESELSPSDYSVLAERGVIQSKWGMFLAVPRRGLVNADRTTWRRSPKAVRVIYTVTAEVPADVKQAFAQIVGHWYRHVKTLVISGFQNVEEQRYGEVSVSYRDVTEVPDEVKSLLAAYRTPAV